LLTDAQKTPALQNVQPRRSGLIILVPELQRKKREAKK
jgi:hypothetical protein